MLTPAEFLKQPPTFQVGELIVGKQGSKGAQLVTSDGATITLKFGSPQAPCQAPFGLSSWQGEANDRVSLDLRVSPESELCIKAIDDAVLCQMQAHFKKYFGTQVSWDKVLEWFRPTLKVHDEGKYPSLVRTKLSKSRVKCWLPGHEPGDIENLPAPASVCAVFSVRSLYFQSKGWGVCLEVQHVLLADTPQNCPWESLDDE